MSRPRAISEPPSARVPLSDSSYGAPETLRTLFGLFQSQTQSQALGLEQNKTQLPVTKGGNQKPRDSNCICYRVINENDLETCLECKGALLPIRRYDVYIHHLH